MQRGPTESNGRAVKERRSWQTERCKNTWFSPGDLGISPTQTKYSVAPNRIKCFVSFVSSTAIGLSRGQRKMDAKAGIYELGEKLR